jgi:hypothetical protein
MQTLISINVPSLAIWGWIFSGLILAYEDMDAPIENLQGVQKRKLQKSFRFSSMVCCFCCMVLVSPLINRDVKLANALSGNQIPDISHALLIYPRDADQMAGAAIVYEKLGRGKEALELAKCAILENPNSPRAWRVILESEEANQMDKGRASLDLKILDPFYSQG